MPHPERTVLLIACLALTAAAAEPVKFNRDIRPIMSDTCFRCHGPDKRARMAGMRLDRREDALKPNPSGAIPIVPGNPDKSAIIQRIFAADPARRMPPKYAEKVLTEAQKDTIRRWVAEGAVYEGHWAYQPVARPPVPAMADPKAPLRNPIDNFIQARLAREQLTPSPEADRRTLLRRATLDLTGLPPTPQEAAAFLNDSSPDAYEKLVDRLLASPAYAEMRAMHWLDAVRFADSAGFHGDNIWPVWPYRDYVLRAFRDDMPFDRFTREQLAGDLLPNATVEQKVAAAYNRLNRASAEGGLQPKEYLAKYGADRVRTLSTVWLGSTMGCAECHDHKFDPFTNKDFYAMKAFFADIQETGQIPDRGRGAWGEKLPLPTEEQRRRLKELDEQITAVRRGLDVQAQQLKKQRWAWEDRLLPDLEAGKLAWTYQRPTAAVTANGAKLTVYNDEAVDSNFYLNGSLSSEHKRGEGLIVASGPNPDNETYAVTFKPGAGAWTALGIDVFQDESLPGSRFARGADRFVLTEVDAEISEPGAPPRRLPFVLATSGGIGERIENPPMAAIDGDPKTGWGVTIVEEYNPFLALRFAEPLRTSADSAVTVRLHQDSDLRRATIGRFRVALSAAAYSWPEDGESDAKTKASPPDNPALTLTVAAGRGLPPDLEKILRLQEDERSQEQKDAVLDFFEFSSPELQKAYVHLARLRAERDLLDAAIPRVLLTVATRPRVTRVLPRANWMDDTHEIVEPAVPAFLGKLDTAGRRATRLDLADWLVSSQNPLTARAFVNRLWREFFGTGLSKVLEDLGSQGEWPVNPELLDWLAAEFMHPEWDAQGAHDWDVRHIIRTIVTSHAYRQSSLSNAQIDERDPDNRLLARQNRYRVDAEIVHDVALSVSGLLVERFGGPSVRPYEPAGYLAAMNFPKREYSASRGADLYRRALYTEWQRTFLHPTLQTFDAPTREECTVNRVSSNTPLQALDLMNDPIFVEAARVFGENIVRQGGPAFDRQLDWAFESALNRAPGPEERQILKDLYNRSLERFRASPESAAQLMSIGEAPHPATQPEEAAMTLVARAILNLHETITRN
ncbi:MAG TPA: PSD1 and planctomycete cytochrome C domain-containing protein [Bryobacteraceae bacterium]|nr:PSD1 and planctomycete cytochrome C domain-containing protein [Bryobacteraceae bacterium]